MNQKKKYDSMIKDKNNGEKWCSKWERGKMNKAKEREWMEVHEEWVVSYMLRPLTWGEIFPNIYWIDGYMCPRICVDAARNWKQIAYSSVIWSTAVPPPNFFGKWQSSKCMKSWEHKTITYLDCPSLGFDSSSTGDTARRPLGPARHYTVHSCLISASVVFEHIALSLQSRRRSSCYIRIFIFFCNSNGQYRTDTVNYRNFPDNEHYSVFWQVLVAQVLN